MSEAIEKDFLNLEKLGSIDKNHLEILSRDFEKFLKVEGKKGALFLVGGILTKPLPRKDVDIAVVIENEENDKFPKTSYTEAMDQFLFLQKIVNIIILENKLFRMGKVIFPCIDEEFGSESILKHTGSIEIKPEKGTPIELANVCGVSVKNFREKEKRPYIELINVS